MTQVLILEISEAQVTHLGKCTEIKKCISLRSNCPFYYQTNPSNSSMCTRCLNREKMIATSNNHTLSYSAKSPSIRNLSNAHFKNQIFFMFIKACSVELSLVKKKKYFYSDAFFKIFLKEANLLIHGLIQFQSVVSIG